MRKVKRLVGVALAGWVVLSAASLASAQAPERQQRREERRGTTTQTAPVRERTTTTVREGEGQPSKALRAKDVLGSKVSIQGGTGIGTVDDIVFGRDGTVDYLLVLKDGKYVVVPWQAAKFNFGQRTATVNITQERFKQVPTYTPGQWPNFYEQSFQQQTYGYYGLRPGQERRLERREGIRRR